MQVFKFCRSKCHAAFKKKKNPRKTKWTKAYRKNVGKELSIDPSFEFEKKRNIPIKYDRALWTKTVETVKKIDVIRQRRSNAHIMQRLRKGRVIQQEKDIKEVQRDLSLIRSPAAGLKNREKLEESHDEDVQIAESDDETMEAEEIPIEN